MKSVQLTQLVCPVCETRNIATKLEIVAPEFLSSLLSEKITIKECQNCNHVFNEIDDKQYQDLVKYYEKFPSGGSFASPSLKVDVSETLRELSSSRYIDTAELISKYCNRNDFVLDLGCAEGGLLGLLERKDFTNLFGIDVNPNFINEAQRLYTGANFYPAKVEDIPFPDNYFDIVVMDQVLEHIRSPQDVIREVSRVLKKNGKIIIGVPDLNQYAQTSFFQHYWFLLKEHLHHFTLATLSKVLAKNDYSCISHFETLSPLLTPETPLPNLLAVFEKQDDPNHPDIPSLTTPVFDFDEYLNTQNYYWQFADAKIDQIILSGRPILCWGISRELQYLFGNSALAHANVKEFIDSSVEKVQQSNLNYREVVARIPYTFLDDSIHHVLLITAVAHSASIEKAALNLGFLGEIVRLDRTLS